MNEPIDISFWIFLKSYIALIVSIFILSMTCIWAKYMTCLQVLVRILFSGLMLYSTVFRIIVFKYNLVKVEDRIQFYVNFFDFIYIAICIVLFLIMWRENYAGGNLTGI
jgi:hypothetical protein